MSREDDRDDYLLLLEHRRIRIGGHDRDPDDREFRTAVLAHLRKLHQEHYNMTDDFTAAQTGLDAAIAQVSTDVNALVTAISANPAAHAAVVAELAALGASTAALAAVAGTAEAAITPTEPAV